MATGRVNVQVLDVGQGQGTFVEIYDTGGKLINTLLFDLGSENNKEEAGGPSVDYLVTTLKTMTKPTVDLLILSHRDSDHINLVGRLLSKFKPAELDINEVRYSGRADWYPKDLLKKLAKYTGSSLRVKPFVICETGYNGATQVFTPFYDDNEVKVFLLVVNAPAKGETIGKAASTLPKTPQKKALNTKSVVCMVEYDGDQHVICGDATFTTFCVINKIFQGNRAPFPRVKMLTMPHHGSRKTTFGLGSTNGKISQKKNDVIEAFVDLARAESLTVSADRKFYHPSLETIEAFWSYVKQDDPWYKDPDLQNDLHSMAAALDIELTFADGTTTEYDYYSFQTKTNVYSTLYSLGVDVTEFSYPPAERLYDAPGNKAKKKKIEFPNLPEGVRWRYSMTPTTFTLYRHDNRAPIGALAAPEISRTTRAWTHPAKEKATVSLLSALHLPGVGPLAPPLAHAPVRPGVAARPAALGRLKVLR